MGKSTTKSIAYNVSWLFVGNSINGIILFFTVIFVARILGAEFFGLYQLAQAFLAYLLIMVDYSLSIFGTREISQAGKNAGRISANLFMVRLLLAIVVFFISIILVFFAPITGQMRLIFIATFSFVFYRAFNADWAFQAIEKMRCIPLAKIMFSLLSLLFIIFFVKSPVDLVNIPLIQASCGLATSFFFLFILFKYYLPFQKGYLEPLTWPKYFIRALPLGASVIMVQIYNNLDTVMLGLMDKAAVVGYYSVAYKVYFVLIGFLGLWQYTAIPVMNKRMSLDMSAAKIFLEKYIRLTILFFSPFIVLVFLLAPLIIRMAFGDEYIAAIPALRLLILSLLPIILSSNYGMLLLIPAGSFNNYFFSVASGAIVNVIFNYFFISHYSLVGAAGATIIAEITVLLMVIYFSKNIINVPITRNIIKTGFYLLLSYFAYFLINVITIHLPIMLRFSFSAFVFVAVYTFIAGYSERIFIFGFIREIVDKKSIKRFGILGRYFNETA